MIIGVTGRYCSGKTTVAHMLETVIFGKKTAQNISVDRIGYQALEQHVPVLVDEFGPSIVNTDGAIQRKVLADIVFRDSTKLIALERIVHPWMIRHIQSLVKRTTSHLIIDAALLHYMGLHTLCDVILIVHSPFIIRMLRGKKRDALHLSGFLMRNAQQRKIPNYWQYVFHTIYKEKKSLNLKKKSSELLVSGVLQYSRLEKKLYKIVEEVYNETRF